MQTHCNDLFHNLVPRAFPLKNGKRKALGTRLSLSAYFIARSRKEYRGSYPERRRHQ